MSAISSGPRTTDVADRPEAAADRTSRWSDWWYPCLGLVLFPAATALAWSHLRVEGLTMVTSAAILGAVAGLGSLVTGGRRLWAAADQWRRLVAVPVGAALIYGVLMPWCIAVVATAPPRPVLDDGAAVRVGLEPSNVSFRAHDGVTLSGWYVPPDNGAVVILLHGSSSTRADVMDEAAVFVRAGYGVLAYDARGHGRSDGRAMEFGWNADADVSAAIDELVGARDAAAGRIAVYGASLGGEVALGAAARDARIGAVIAEGATGRTAADRRWLVEAYGWRGSIQLAVDHVTYGLVDSLVDEGPPPPLREDVGHTTAPVLMVTAGDAPDEARAARWIRTGSPDGVEVWTVRGAAHTEGLETRPDAWTERVVGFLDDTLAA